MSDEAKALDEARAAVDAEQRKARDAARRLYPLGTVGPLDPIIDAARLTALESLVITLVSRASGYEGSDELKALLEFGDYWQLVNETICGLPSAAPEPSGIEIAELQPVAPATDTVVTRRDAIDADEVRAMRAFRMVGKDRVLELAIEIGRQWREQDGIHGSYMDALADMTAAMINGPTPRPRLRMRMFATVLDAPPTGAKVGDNVVVDVPANCTVHALDARNMGLLMSIAEQLVAWRKEREDKSDGLPTAGLWALLDALVDVMEDLSPPPDAAKTKEDV